MISKQNSATSVPTAVWKLPVWSSMIVMEVPVTVNGSSKVIHNSPSSPEQTSKLISVPVTTGQPQKLQAPQTADTSVSNPSQGISKASPKSFK